MTSEKKDKIKSLLKRQGVILADIALVLMLGAIIGNGPNIFQNVQRDMQKYDSSLASGYDGGYTDSYQLKSEQSRAPMMFSKMASTESAPMDYESPMLNNAVTYGAGAEYKAEAVYDDIKPNESSNQKLIKTYNLSYETKTFDTFLDEISKNVSIVGGYISSTNVSQKYANYTVKVPCDRVQEFLDKIGKDDNLINMSISTEDVTLSYSDTVTKLKTLRAEYDKLSEFFDKAENVSETLDVARYLSDLQIEIDTAESRLRVLDSQIDYSTINITITDVKEYTQVEEDTFATKIKKAASAGLLACQDNLENFVILAIFVAPNLITFLIGLAIIIFIILCIKSFISKRNKRKHKVSELEIKEDSENNEKTVR